MEGVELRIATIGGGVDLRRSGVAPAAHLRRVALGVGEDHLPLLVRLGTDLLGPFLTFGAGPGGDFLPVGAHPVVDAVEDRLAPATGVVGQVDALDADVGDLDAEGGRTLVDPRDEFGGDVATTGLRQLAQRAAVDQVPQGVLDDRRQAGHGLGLDAAAGRAVVLRDVGDAPCDEVVDLDVLLLRREVTLVVGRHRQESTVEGPHGVDQGGLEAQPRLDVLLDDLAEAEHEGRFALVHGVERAASEDEGDGTAEQQVGKVSDHVSGSLRGTGVPVPAGRAAVRWHRRPGPARRDG